MYFIITLIFLEEELQPEHSRSWKQSRTELKDQCSIYLPGSAPRTFLETGLQQQKPADNTPVVLETDASGGATIDPDEETRMNEELREKYLYRRPSTSRSGQNTCPNPQKTNEEKNYNSTINAKKSGTDKDFSDSLKRRGIRGDDNNHMNRIRIVDLTNEDQNNNEYGENNEENGGKDVNSGDSNQLHGDEDSKLPLNNIREGK